MDEADFERLLEDVRTAMSAVSPPDLMASARPVVASPGWVPPTAANDNLDDNDVTEVMSGTRPGRSALSRRLDCGPPQLT
jgi:hypothetical protein